MTSLFENAADEKYHKKIYYVIKVIQCILLGRGRKMNVLDTYKEAEKCKETHNYRNFYVCLKEYLGQVIKDDKDLLLGLKMQCQENADSSIMGAGLSVAALIVAIGSLIVNMTVYDEGLKDFMTVITIIAVITIFVLYRIWNEKRKKFSQILFVLNEIESDMNKR